MNAHVTSNKTKRLFIPVLFFLMFFIHIASPQADAATIASAHPEYMRGDTAVITGQGFTNNTQVIIEVIRADSSIVTGAGTDTPGSDTVTTDGSGAFSYNYLLEGASETSFTGTFTVNARYSSNPSVIVATANFDDDPRYLLQGCSRGRGDCTEDSPATGWADGISPMDGWTSGNLSGWYELENVPYRLRMNLRYPSDANTYYIMNEQDNLRNSINGIDVGSGFYVGYGPGVSGFYEGYLKKTCVLQTNRTTLDVPTTVNPCIVTGPTYSGVDDDGNNGIDEDPVNGLDDDGDGYVDEDPSAQSPSSQSRRIQYVWAVKFETSEVGSSSKKWGLYWKGHLGSGSSIYPGSSLHSNTTATGNQDVPINNVLPAPSGADLSITKGESSDPVTAGSNLTYTINVSNSGPGTATNVVVTDTLPGGTSFISAGGTGWTCGEAGGTVTCTMPALAVGSASPITIVVAVPSEGGSITNSASVTATESDSNTGNNSTSISTTVNASVNLSITKSASPDPVITGATLTYTINVSNSGPSTATNVQVSDTLPGTVTFGSVSGTGWTCGELLGVVTCSRASLPPGSAPAITITVTAPSLSGSITNGANVSSNEIDSDINNNSVTILTSVNTPPVSGTDLSLTKTGLPNPVLLVGEPLTYYITVTNNGPSAATGVTVTDTLPTPDVSPASSVTTTQGTCTGTTSINCTIGNLSNGGSATVTIVVQTLVETMVSNTATVSGNETDSVPGNNSATVVIPVGDLSRLINISTRAPVLTGDNVMIGGFTLGGLLPKTILVRGFGPTLADWGVSGSMANPYLELYSGQTLIASNDNWQTPITQCDPPATACGTPQDIQATGKSACQVATTGCSQDSAILATLPAGAYTAILRGVGGGTGVGLVGVDDPDTLTQPKLVNISTRAMVLTGDSVMIGGFIIGAINGNGNKTVLIRAMGPTLADFGVPGPLQDPYLELYSGQTRIAFNDNWQTPITQCDPPAASCGTPQDIQATGKDSCTVATTGCTQDAAILVTLPPGAYTAIVRGVNNGTGVGLVGIDELGQ